MRVYCIIIFAYKLRRDIESEVKKIMNHNEKDNGKDESSVNKVKSSGCNKLCYYSKKAIWLFIGAMIIISAVFFYKSKMSKGETSYKKEKVSDTSRKIKNKLTTKLEHDKIYEDGIEGILVDINKVVQTPKDLYVANYFRLTFNNKGIIETFYGDIYGKNDKGEAVEYGILYESDKSKEISIFTISNFDGNFDEDKRMEPLIKMLNVISLKEAVMNWKDTNYGISYFGKQKLGYNIKEIYYVDKNGNVKKDEEDSFETIGNVVSIFVPGKKEVYPPLQYIFSEERNNNNNNTRSLKESKDKSVNSKVEFHQSDKISYKLEVTDAASGSRFYILKGTIDGGATWSVINKDPFGGNIGVAEGITFLNEKLGFLCLSHSGESYGELYRTEDGGLSYKKVNFQSIKVTLKDGESYEPFAMPEMPYKENESLKVLIGQGVNGDYNGGSKALYESKDEGKTWTYIKEMTRE